MNIQRTNYVENNKNNKIIKINKIINNIGKILHNIFFCILFLQLLIIFTDYNKYEIQQLSILLLLLEIFLFSMVIGIWISYTLIEKYNFRPLTTSIIIIVGSSTLVATAVLFLH